ncbi:MAG: ABC transporter substrate-binding protein [Rhizobiales bacterium]|nr:ABC transporter substrate-binding protein [Hyphomicrobiales bacterium]
MNWLTRAAAVLLAASVSALAPASAQQGEQAPEWRHGASLFGSVKYPADFKHFDYVNPDAPKGGSVRLGAVGTYDNFNMVVSGVKGSLAAGTDLISDTLMTPAYDEVSTEYGLLAEAMRFPADYSSVTYRLRAEAKWHDGKPVTPEDVIYSLEVLKKNSPVYGSYYRHVVKAEQTGERDVTFTFDAPGNRELPQIVGQLTVLPKHWWEGTDANGRKRDVTATTLEPPLGSGAYRIKSFEPGRNIVYERVPDFWGAKVPANVGRDNFDAIRFEYFRDPTVALEAFKGDQIDWRTENSAKNWATAYDFPAVRDKRVLLEEFPIRNQGIMQAFVFNTRRDKFKDPRVRQALNYAFDFEEINKTMFFGQYVRIDSYFMGTELAWNWRPDPQSGAAPDVVPAAENGLPQGRELEILETVRDQVPPEVFTTPFRNPTGTGPEAMRANLREAMRLLKEAGYEIRNRRLVNARTGEPLTIEFLLSEPTFERVALFLKPSLERLGIEMTVRTVDDSQYENRLRSWDFDVVVGSWPQSLSPGNEQRTFWGSAAADQPGSRNFAGIRSPAVDKLIDRIIFAKDRAELVAATRALDRVLLWGHYVIPQWTYGKMRTARWDRYGRPETMPVYGAAAFPTIWWAKQKQADSAGAPASGAPR